MQHLYCISDEELAFDNWVATYQPVANPHDDNASFEGFMFETFGPELEQVKAAALEHRGKVWTLVDCGGVSCFTAGYHLVNRLGYFICAVPFNLANPPRDFVA